MRTGFKKIAAFLTAAAIAATISGCTAENGYIMEVDGMPIRTGIYLSLQQNSMSNGGDALYEILGDELDNIDNYFTQSINGKSFSDWVKDDTKRAVKRFVGVQRLCEQFGIVLSDDERTKLSKNVQSNWDITSIDYYGYSFSIKDMYGYETMGGYYESQGIGIDSLKEIAYTNALSDKLFKYYYGEGGEDAVPDEEIDEYLEENSVAYRLITLQYVDFRGDPVIDLEQDPINELASSLAEKYNNGASWIDIVYDYDLYCAQNDAKKKAEEEYEENPPEGVSYDDYIAEAVSEATATRHDDEDDDMFDEIVFNENSYLSDTLMNFLLGAPADGTAIAYYGTTAAYVIVRNPVSNFPGWKLENIDSVLRELRSEAFDSKMDLLCQDYDVVQQDSLVNKKYAPEKLYK